KQVSSAAYHSLVVKLDGTVWAFGYNPDGELGDGSVLNHGAPVQVVGLTNVTAVAAGYFHSLALKSDGTVSAWGFGLLGELGDGTNGDGTCACRLTPVAVSGLSGVTAISAGNEFSMALKNDGT